MLRLTSPSLRAALVAAAVTGFCGAPALAGNPAAPSFVVRDLEGKTVRLSDLKGKAVVLDFWATWCGPCRASMPHLSQIQERYARQGLVVLGLSLDDLDPRSVRRFANQLRITFRLGMADERVLNSYGPIRSVPTTYFINRRGEVIRRVVGYIDAETMEAYTLELF